MTRCTSTTRAGHPCKRHAVQGSRPPRCFAHGGRPSVSPKRAAAPAPTRHGFYERTYSPAEIAALQALADEPGLDDEVEVARVVIRRVMERLKQELDPAEYRRLVAIALSGANTVARLLRAQRDLGGQPDDDFAGAVAQGLDAICQDYGTEL